MYSKQKSLLPYTLKIRMKPKRKAFIKFKLFVKLLIICLIYFLNMEF